MHRRVAVESEILGAGTDLFLSLFVVMVCIYVFLVVAGATARKEAEKIACPWPATGWSSNS